MEADASLFPSATVVWVAGLYLVVLYVAIRQAPWRRLLESEQLNVFLGASVAILMLWLMKADVRPGFAFHLLGVTSVTLMFGWSFGIIIASLALLGAVLNDGAGWEAFAFNILFVGILPVTLTQIFLVLIRHFLPKHFFIYVLGNAFFTAGAVGWISGMTVIGALVLNETYTWADVQLNILPFFPLMYFPEAFVNGWVMTILISLRPTWVYSFSDEQYLKGK